MYRGSSHVPSVQSYGVPPWLAPTEHLFDKLRRGRGLVNWHDRARSLQVAEHQKDNLTGRTVVEYLKSGDTTRDAVCLRPAHHRYISYGLSGEMLPDRSRVNKASASESGSVNKAEKQECSMFFSKTP